MSIIHTRPPGEGRTWRYVGVNMNGGKQTIWNGPCVFGGVMVSNSLSAHVVRIEDGNNLVTAVAPSAPAGTAQIISPNGVEIKESLVVVPDASASGRITVLWQTLNDTQIEVVRRQLSGELRQAPRDTRDEPPPRASESEKRQNTVFRNRK